MKPSEAIRIAWEAIVKNKIRSFLTMLGIIIGTGAVIALLSVGEGAREAITSQIQSIGSNLVFVFPGAYDQNQQRPSRYAKPARQTPPAPPG